MKSNKRKGLDLKCFGCGKGLRKPGALLFSPPNYPYTRLDYCCVEKFHICVICYKKLDDYIVSDKLK